MQMQAQVRKPEFDLKIKLNERSFLLTTKFSIQMSEWKKREKNKAITINKPQKSEFRTKRRRMYW
jgi:hypothetical protein